MNKKFTKLIAALALLVFMTPSMAGWGQNVDSYTATSADKPSAVNGTTTGSVTGTNSISWSYSVTQETKSGKNPYVAYTDASGWQLGSGNSPCKAFSISTSGISGTITKIETVTGSASASSKINVTVGGEAFGAQNQSTGTGATVATQTFNGVASGTIVVSASASSAAFYFKSVSVTYTTGYTVTFDCDGGEGCPDDMTGIASGENNFTVPDNVPTKDCYTFDEFYYDANDNMYEVGETYTITGDLALTASWALNKYTITYYSNNGASGEDGDEEANCGSSYTIADDPGFTAPTATPNFINWNTQADGEGTSYEVNQQITVSGNLDLYAQWSATPRYTVTYDCKGGTTGCPENQFVLGGTQIQLPAAPSKEGFAFNGWMCDVDMETYAAGDDYTVTANVGFEAQWTGSLATPTIAVAGVSNGTANTYYVTAQVTINQTDGAYIYYTTDGTTPTAQSTEYVNPFSVTSSCTIKAIAIFEGYADSEIVSQEIIIVQPNEATFTNGVYSETFSSSLGLWYAYNVTGDNVWTQGSVTASSTTYTGANINGYQQVNEDWLISPKMTAENGKVVVSFNSVARYSSSYKLVVKYSTNYNGYGAPSSATWKSLSATIASAPNNGFSSWTSSGNVVISELSTSTDSLTNSTPIYVAFVYTSATGNGNATQYFIKNFTAKQYYPVNYLVNGGSGTMESDYYAVGETAFIPYPYMDSEEGFTAPEGMAFASWNTQADGQGTTYHPDDEYEMGASALNLYAQWATAYQLTVGDPENIDIHVACGEEALINGESTNNVVEGMRIEMFVEEVAQGYEFGQFIVTKADQTAITPSHETISGIEVYYFNMPAQNVTITATVNVVTTVVDELTYELINVGSSYTEWSGKKSNSNAVYAGQSAGGDNNSGNCIQLRSKNSNSGIVTTTSGGKVKKIVVTWNDQTSNNNRLDVYGKNTPYEDATNLYGTSGNSNQGAFLGSITKGTSTELTVEDDYTYLGLRSYSGALYIDKIEITWDANYSATTNVTAHTDNEGWYFIASPFAANQSLTWDSITTHIRSTDTVLYYYDEATHYWRNIKVAANADGFDYANGKGYLYANNQSVTLTFAGTSLVEGDVKEITLDYHATTSANENNPLAGWNLVGNPFNCNATLDMDCFIIDGMAINTTAQTAGEYIVAPCQGVMVKAIEDGQAVTFTKHPDNAPAPQPNQLQVTVAQQVMNRGAVTSTVNDNVIVNFNEGSLLEKFSFNAEAAKLYIPQNDKEYAIVSAEAQGEMPLNFRANADGQYTLTVNPEGIEMNYLHLIDNMTGANVDLLSTPSYTFTAKTTDYESRFRLVFASNGTSTSSATEETFAFFSNGNLAVNNEGEATLQVIDVMGRVLSSQTISGTAELSLNQVPGVYVLRLVNGNDVKTQKIVVR